MIEGKSAMIKALFTIILESEVPKRTTYVRSKGLALQTDVWIFYSV